MKSALYLCGAGNAEGVRLAIRVNQKFNYWAKIFILDDDDSKKGKDILGIKIIGGFDVLNNIDRDNSEIVNLVARTTEKRKSAYEKLSRYNVPFTSLVDPEVDTWGVSYSGDVIIYPKVTFSANASIEHGSVVFTGAVVGHGCSVGKFCIIAPGAVLNARIMIEDGVYVGTNASVLPDLKIGKWATIGLNSGVVQNVPAFATAMGVPAELIIDPRKTGGDISDNKLSEEHSSLKKPCGKEIDSLEDAMIDIWKKILKIEKVELNDNFFHSGGTSLLAVQLYSELKKILDIKITLIDIFHYPTIKSFIEFINNKKFVSTDVTITSNSKRVTLFRKRFAGSSGNKPGSI